MMNGMFGVEAPFQGASELVLHLSGGCTSFAPGYVETGLRPIGGEINGLYGRILS